jgi:hypothetical protein
MGPGVNLIKLNMYCIAMKRSSLPKRVNKFLMPKKFHEMNPKFCHKVLPYIKSKWRLHVRLCDA